MTTEGRRAAAWPRLLVAGASALLLALAVLHQRSDLAGREAVERFFKDFTLDARRPELLGTARVEGSADLAMLVAVRAATLDVAGATALGQLEPEVRGLWLRSVREMPEEVAAARGLALEAIARRPAWAFHSLALAELVLADEWREPPDERRTERWLAPARVAVAWAPDAPGIRAAWAAAALDRWAALTAEERLEARGVVRSALRDEGFQRIALRAVVAVMGVADGLSLLPETPEAIAAARQVLADAATFEERVAVEERWVAAEREERRRAVAEMAGYLEAGRGDKAAAAAAAFLAAHPVGTFDDAEGREQARVVLRAVGDGRPGDWLTDPRGKLVRWSLANRRRVSEGGDLRKAASGLRNVPDGARALMALYAGDEAGWRRLVERSDTKGSSEWTPFYVELARRSLEQKAPAEAEAALRKVSRFDLGQCEVLLVRRAVARARGAGLAELQEEWAAAFRETLDVSRFPATGAGELPVCVDPERGEAASLAVSLVATEPALVAWGWDGARSGTVRLEAGVEQALTVPLAGLEGQRALTLAPVLGRGVRLAAARVAP